MAKKVKTRAAYNIILTKLKPCNLVSLRLHLASISSYISAVKSHRLQEIDGLPRLANDIRNFHDYRDSFCKELSSLRITESEGAKIIIIMNLLEDALVDKIARIVENNLPEGFKAKWSGKQSIADFIIQVYLEAGNLDLIRKAIHQHGTLKPKGYVYYTAAYRESLKAIPHKPGDVELDWAEGILSDDFKHYLEEPLCDMSIIELDGEWYFDIVHGGSGEQGELINEKSEREDYALQRPEYDTLVFNPKTGDLMMHLQTKRANITSCYLHVLSQIIFHVEDYWSKSEKFSLSPFSQPIEKIKNEVLNLGSLADKNPLLIRVGLSSITISKSFAQTAEVGRIRTTTKKISDNYCLTTEKKPDDILFEEDYDISSATLSFEFSNGKGGVNKSSITLSSNQKTPRGKSTLIGIDEWLTEIGIALLGESLENRRKKFEENSKLREQRPVKKGREKNRPLLLEFAKSSNKRIPKKNND